MHLLLLLVACGGSTKSSTSSSTNPTTPSTDTDSEEETESSLEISAATADTASDPPWLTDDRYVFVNTHDIVSASVGYEWFGSTLLSGMDLDHDGVLEWAVALPWESTYPYADASVVTVFEGTTVIAERRKEEFKSSVVLLGAGDANGDGFPDLQWKSCLGNIQCRIQVTVGVTSDADASIAMSMPDEDHSAIPIALDRIPGASSSLVAWWLPAIAVTYGALPSEPSTDELPTQASWDHAILDHRIPEAKDVTEATYVTTVRLIQEPDRDPTHFLLGTTGSWDYKLDRPTAHLRVCPLEGLLDLHADCPPLPADEPIGLRAMDADLDGDGVREIVTSAYPERDAPGAVWIFERDGTWRATVRGLSTRQFGRHIEFAIDDDGERWLLAGSASAFDTIYAFRASGLSGELTTDDADRLYVDPGGAYFWNMTTYRETAEGPLWLVVGGYPAVFRRPFAP